ncbi:MAG: glycosyltransferase [Pyrinomonadaceae bacterium]
MKNQNNKSAEMVLKGENILCFSHDWTGDPLSKTHLMRILAKDNRVLWVNAIANRMPTASGKDVKRIFSKLKKFTEPVKQVEPNIFVLNPLAIPTYGSEVVRAFNQKFLRSQVRKAMRALEFSNPVNMVFNPAAGLLAGKLGERGIIYYCVDDYTEFTGVAAGLKEIEIDLFKRADLVVVSAEKLFEDKRKYNERTFIIRHGTDWNHFRKALSDETVIPEEVQRLPHPIIGFHGLLADWVDFELIKRIAERFKTGSVVLVGKVAVDAEQKIKTLNGVKNIHLLGRKPYEQLPAYCKAFDVALNPFEINDLTLAANPLKVREYLAAGLQVVSTDIPEVRILKYCRIGKTHEEFVSEVEAALETNIERTKISDSIREESWDAKVDELRVILFENLENGKITSK